MLWIYHIADCIGLRRYSALHPQILLYKPRTETCRRQIMHHSLRDGRPRRISFREERLEIALLLIEMSVKSEKQKVV